MIHVPIGRENLVPFIYGLHRRPADPGCRWLAGPRPVDRGRGGDLLDDQQPDRLLSHLACKEETRRESCSGGAGREPKLLAALATGMGGTVGRRCAEAHAGSASRLRSVGVARALFIMAFTAFSISLYGPVFYPLMSTVSQTTPSPLSARVPAKRLCTDRSDAGFAGRSSTSRQMRAQSEGGRFLQAASSTSVLTAFIP